MFWFIFEDGEVKKSDTYCDDDVSCVDAGILDLIDVSGDELFTMHEGEWIELPSV